MRLGLVSRKSECIFSSANSHATATTNNRTFVARKLLLGKLDVEFSIRGILRGFGLKMGVATRKSFEARVRELSAGQAMR
jgi:hypothetical protein